MCMQQNAKVFHNKHLAGRGDGFPLHREGKEVEELEDRIQPARLQKCEGRLVAELVADGNHLLGDVNVLDAREL